MGEFFKKTLSNGMIVIMEKRELPVVSFSISNKFGAGFEDLKIKGIAHVIEHMLFTGTKKRSHEEISKEIESKGGILNAFTTQELTSFWFKLPSEHLFSGIEILADILNNALFDEKKFEKEKKVILEEIKMYHDDPSRSVYDKILENPYEFPFGKGISGDENSVSSLKRDFVFDYYKKFYIPSNYIVVIVGDADFDKVCAILEKSFKAKDLEIKEIKIIKKNFESRETRAGIDQAHFILAMHAPLLNEKDYSTLEVLDAYLANGMSSRLFLKIREEKGLAYSIQSSISSEKSYSYYSIYTGSTKEAIPEIKKIIIEEMEKINEMKEEELEQAKERVIGLRKISSEESVRVMSELIFYELSDKAEVYYNHEKKISAVDLEGVKKLAKEMIKRYSTAAIVPK